MWLIDSMSNSHHHCDKMFTRKTSKLHAPSRTKLRPYKVWQYPCVIYLRLFTPNYHPVWYDRSATFSKLTNCLFTQTHLDAPNFERISELWFEDGTITIRVEHAEFRVYGGILAARSSVFKDMLSFPQPQPSTKIHMLKGSAPLISLQDPVEDVHAFLSSIFDSSWVVLPECRAGSLKLKSD